MLSVKLMMCLSVSLTTFSAVEGGSDVWIQVFEIEKIAYKNFPFSLTCVQYTESSNNQSGNVTWEFTSATTNSSIILTQDFGRYSIGRNEKMEKENEDISVLTIHNVDYSDRGFYSCIVGDGERNATVFIRVHDYWTGLAWPFLGIVVLVVVLSGILFVFEKRRRTQLVVEEEEADPTESRVANIAPDEIKIRNRK